MARNTRGASRLNGGSRTTPEAESGATEARHDELVDSLRRAIDRRDERIEKLTVSLDREMQAVEILRRARDELDTRVAGLERTLEHRTQTCYRLRELLREARAGMPAREAGELDMAESLEAPDPAGHREQPRWPYGVDVAAPDAEPVGTATVPDMARQPRSPAVGVEETATDRVRIRAAPASPEHGDAGTASRPAMALLGLDDDPPKKYAVDKEIVTIGRSRFSDVTIDSRLVSRLHARICVDEGRAVIEDLGSTNGIKVNSRRVERAELADGDLIDVGRKRFRFVVDDE